MTNLGLPLGSLRREEIYTFMGGLYIALSWTIFILLSHPYDIGKTQHIIAFVFALMWLTSVVVLYVILVVLYLALNSLGGRWTKNSSIAVFKSTLNANDPIVNYYPHGYSETIITNNHIDCVLLLSVIISAYPVFGIIGTFVREISPKFSIIALVAIIPVVGHRIWQGTKCRYSFEKLVSSGDVEYIDYKKYSEETAKYIADLRITSTKNKINTYVGNSNK